ncbi:hypothetical protein WICPIJ_005607 [Wickerhamomyces pijperi]|uniref:Uncharacterized protein n=1 Tax=Wickerhamomyces pijperi TaxID=599730 RepID=A0A9P8TKX6_WICPI|nr:hypothetical protein WICPIJ_005607 [Wickerhamomyces pijperi]
MHITATIISIFSVLFWLSLQGLSVLNNHSDPKDIIYVGNFLKPAIFPYVMLLFTLVAVGFLVWIIYFKRTTLGQIGLLTWRIYGGLTEGKVQYKIGQMPNPVAESVLCSLELSHYDFAGYSLTLLLIFLSQFNSTVLIWIRLSFLIVAIILPIAKLGNYYAIMKELDSISCFNLMCDLCSGLYSLMNIYSEVDYTLKNESKLYVPHSTLLVASTIIIMSMKIIAVLWLVSQRMNLGWSNGNVSRFITKYAEFLRSHSLTAHIRNLPYDTTAEDIIAFIWNKLKRTNQDENFQFGVPLKDLEVDNDDDGDHDHEHDDNQDDHDEDDDNGNDQGNDNGSSNNEGPGNRRSLLGGYNEDDGPVNDAPPVNDNGDNEINPGGSLSNEGHGRGRVHSGLFDGSVGLSNQLNTEAADLENGKHHHGQKLHKRVTRRSEAIANEAKQAGSSLSHGVIGQNGAGFNPGSSGGSAVDPDLKIKTS